MRFLRHLISLIDMRAISIVAVCCVTLLMASIAGAAQKFKPAPGCKRASELSKLEASLKGEKKIPYDGESNPLARCNAVQPVPTAEMRSTGEPSVAIIVFDVTGSGRVVNQQAIGQKAQWTEAAQEALSQTLYEPLVEGDIGITRVGVKIAFVVEFEGRGQSCGRLQVNAKQNSEVRICAQR